MSSKRYYWLKLKENFFEEETIKLLEAMDNGKDYIIFLLKLRLRSLNDNGYLSFKGIMPYNEKMLGTITGTNVDIVKAALPIFQEVGLMERLDDGTLFMKQVDELTSSEGSSAKWMRTHRAKLQQLPEKVSHSDGDVENSERDIDIEKDIEKDIDIDKPTTKPAVTKIKYADYVAMTEDEYEKLLDRFGKNAANEMIEILDNYKGSKGRTYKNDYRAILSWVVKRWKEEHPGVKDPKNPLGVTR